MIDLKQLAENLRRYNAWRRGAEGVEMPSPKDLGTWIEEAVRILESLEPEPIKCESCEDLAQQMRGSDSLTDQLIQVATGEISHIYIGVCPDCQTGYGSRDPDCPACIVLMRAEAKLLKADQPAASPSIAPAIMQAITEDARAEEAFPGNPLARRVEMTGAEIDCLVALVEKGPLWDGDVPSKRGRDSLIDNGLAVRAIVSGADGYTAATYAGRDAYKCHFGTALGGDAGTIDEAKANRQALRAIAKATETKQPKGE